MTISVLQGDLSKGLSVVERAVATRSTLPVLGNILFASDGGRLKLSATNLSVALTCWLSASVTSDWATTVPARTIGDLVDNLPPERIDMELESKTETLGLTCGRFVNNVRGIQAAEFPVISAMNEADAMRMDPDVLKTALSQSAYAAASDESRPILTGVLAKFYNDNTSGIGRVTFAAVNGFRLAVRTVPLLGTVAKPTSVIIPAHALVELQKVIGKDPVLINTTPTQASFRTDNVEMVCQLIDGNFPDYTTIVPKKHETSAVISTVQLLRACKAARVFARESANVVRLRLTPGSNGAGSGKVALLATSAETGDNEGELDAVVNGVPLEIGFNVEFLKDAITSMTADQVQLETTTASSPGKLSPVGDDGLTCVVMPMHFGKQ